MRRMLLLVVALTATANAAQAADYTLTPLKVKGSGNVAVAGVNDFGVVTGRFLSSGQPQGAGFVGEPGQFVILPDVESGGFSNEFLRPTSINNAGAVIGTYEFGGGYVFVWQNGRYVASSLGQSVDVPSGGLSAFITTHGHLSYDQYEGSGEYVPTAGTIKSQGTLQAGGFPLIASTNASGQIAGQYSTFIGQTPTTAVFVGTLAQIAPLLPPGALSSTGGWINDAGQVAGAYQTPHGFRGFIYTAGAYRTFALPTKPTAIVTQGIDSHDRVVGTYTDANGQYGFVYAHGHATPLGSFAAADTVHVGISQSGRQIVLSDTVAGTQTSQSFTVACSGPGC